MPNWVNTTISINSDLSEEQRKILKKIEKVKGICRYYLPMPKSLNITSPQSTEDEKKQAQINLEKHGAPDWYSWCNREWGTKWGECDFYIDDDRLHFSTAWSPISEKVLRRFIKDFPNFTYYWEEEQGFGAEWDVVNGEPTLVEEWDVPHMEEVTLPNGSEVLFMRDDHKYGDKGYYRDWNICDDEYLGETIEEALENLKEYENEQS